MLALTGVDLAGVRGAATCPVSWRWCCCCGCGSRSTAPGPRPDVDVVPDGPLPRAFHLLTLACALATFGLLTFGVLSWPPGGRRAARLAWVPVCMPPRWASRPSPRWRPDSSSTIGGRTRLVLPAWSRWCRPRHCCRVRRCAIAGILVWGLGAASVDSTVKAWWPETVPRSRLGTAYGGLRGRAGGRARGRSVGGLALWPGKRSTIVTAVGIARGQRSCCSTYAWRSGSVPERSAIRAAGDTTRTRDHHDRYLPVTGEPGQADEHVRHRVVVLDHHAVAHRPGPRRGGQGRHGDRAGGRDRDGDRRRGLQPRPARRRRDVQRRRRRRTPSASSRASGRSRGSRSTRSATGRSCCTSAARSRSPPRCRCGPATTCRWRTRRAWGG